MEIKNVLSKQEINKLFAELCKKNWKVKNIFRDVLYDDYKDVIGDWPKASKLSLLNLLGIEENKEHYGIYHLKK